MNDYRAYVECNYNSLYHHGIKNQKWGVRRFQNEDGSLTPAGRERYLKEASFNAQAADKAFTKNQTDLFVQAHNKAAAQMRGAYTDYYNEKWKDRKPEDQEAYVNTYNDTFVKLRNRELARATMQFYKENPNFKHAYELYKNYSLKELNDSFDMDLKDLEKQCNDVVKDYDDWVKKNSKK